MFTSPTIRAGTVGLGMIFDETYKPFFARSTTHGLYSSVVGPFRVELIAAATRTGTRTSKLNEMVPFADVKNLTGSTALDDLVTVVDAVVIATPDDRHYEPAKAALLAGRHVLIEKPSVLTLKQLDELVALARQNNVLAKVVYHKLLDPDHKKLRTHVQNGTLRHVNSGYCTLLEPKSISTGQFAEWVTGRNPATYVAVHYYKLIDFTFGPNWQLAVIRANGQRGIVADADGSTWDSVQTQLEYHHPDGRSAVFDIHTSWVHPDDFPGYVDQEVQFRFDNGAWNGHQRKRGVEITVEGKTDQYKTTPNHHYNGTFLEPWGEHSQRGYGIETIERFFQEVAFVEYGGPMEERPQRIEAMRQLTYNDLDADRNVVAMVQATEGILSALSSGHTDSVVRVNGPHGGLVQYFAGNQDFQVLSAPRV